ncbi:MAG: mevalonate kinase [Bacteroidia bacterium]
MKESLFYGKILLFGEYGIIQDSMGLSIPYNNYNGKFTFENSSESSKESNEELKKYFLHLKELQKNKQVDASFDLKKLEEDITNGMSFDSTIPQGFGVGSSGALVAAIYAKYGKNSIKAEQNISGEKIKQLKTIFGQMESYFHGKSSGLDPLICYLNLPVVIRSKEDMNTVGLPSQGDSKGAIFLLNTGTPGKTQPLVSYFLDKCKEDGFRNMLKSEFKKYNDACIEAFLNKDVKPLLSNVKKLSKVLLEHFSPMIPSHFQQLWQEGIDSNAYYLKLCGSGGGGFILGFTKDLEKAKKKLANYDLAVVHQF